MFRAPGEPVRYDQTRRSPSGRAGRPRQSPQTVDVTLRERRPLYGIALVLAVLAVVLKQPLLFVAALLIAVISAVPELWYRFGLSGLLISRAPATAQAMLGDTIEIVVTYENRNVLPLPYVEIEDEYPDTLPVLDAATAPATSEGRVVLPALLGIWAYQRVRRRHRVRCVARGAWRLGPVRVRISDPFSILSREETVNDVRSLVVYPLVAPIERFTLLARSPFGEQKSLVRLLEDPLRVAGIRPYQYGDEPRRIHWKATARSGTLQSKVYDPSTRHTLALFLDVRTYERGVYGFDPLLVELAICAAASVSNWGLEQGYAVGLYANGMLVAPELDASSDEMPTADLADARRRMEPMRVNIPASSNPAQLTRLLDGLARLLAFTGLPMEYVVTGELGHLPLGASVIYIGAEAAVDQPLVAALQRARAGGHAVTLLLTQNRDGEPSERGTAHPSAPTLNLAGLGMYRIGGREAWKQLISEALGERATADGDGDQRGDAVAFTRASRAFRLE